MKKLLTQLKNDENGMIISAELVLIVTIGVLGMIVGLNAVAGSINGELNDISSAFGAINQSYGYQGMTKYGHSWVAGSGYLDARDYCDCSVIVPTVGVTKWQGTATPRTYVPQPVAPCVDCPAGTAPHKLAPTPDHGPHHRHPHPKRKHHPHPKGPKLKK